MGKQRNLVTTKKNFPYKLIKAYHYGIGKHNHFKTSGICDNVEGDLISVLPKGLQILIECSKIRSI